MPHSPQHIVAVAGRRVDAANATAKQFPLAQVSTVREAIGRRLAELSAVGLVASAACGADLLALDAAGSANVPVRIVLPFAAGKFRETSVVDRPDPAYWGKLYDRLIADAQARDALIELENQSPSHEAYTLANERILREARSWAASFPQNGSPRLLALLVWNGVPRDKDDATEHFRRAAAATGFACETVQTLPER